MRIWSWRTAAVWILGATFLTASSDFSLHGSFLSPQFDARHSLALAREVSLEEVNVPILDERPLMHHVFNLYFKSQDGSERKIFVEILKALVARGADVNAPYADDPDLIFKAVLLREIDLAKNIASAGALLNTPLILQQLYSLPCEPIPLSKMLLHGQSLLAKRNSTSANIQLDELIKFYSGASLAGAKPVVRSVELSALSPTYDSSVLSAVLSSGFQADISLMDLLTSLGEVSSSIHWLLLSHLLNLRESPSDTQPMEFVARILSLPNQEGRNVLHYLALSGGTALVSDLLRFFDQEHSDGRKLLTEALSTEDQRGFLPMHYAVMRFGSRSSFTHRLQEFHHWVGGFQFSAMQTQLLTELAAVHDSAILNPLPRDQEHREREITVAADGSTVPEIKTKSGAWNGGWSLGRVADPKVAGDDARCDIQEVHSGLPSPQEFFRDYFRKGMPVIFRGALQLQNHSMLSLFQREPFLESYGEDSIPVAQIPYAHTFGQQQRMVNFQEYISGHLETETESHAPPDAASLLSEPPLYAFNVPLPQWKERMQRSVFVPSLLRGLVADTEMQFYLGGLGTGAPVHYHGHAVNSMAYGEKRWILFPPEEAFYSTKPSLSFLREDLRVEGALQCHQRSGDVMYVPSLWAHGTLNTKESIGVAHEFSIEDFCME